MHIVIIQRMILLVNLMDERFSFILELILFTVLKFETSVQCVGALKKYREGYTGIFHKFNAHTFYRTIASSTSYIHKAYKSEGLVFGMVSSRLLAPSSNSRSSGNMSMVV
jgi:hypothetical protein